jgi:hypothetical protein
MPAYPLRAAFAGVLLFVIGLGLAAGIYEVNRREAERLAGWRRADATIVELLKRRTLDGEVVAPLVAFTTQSGGRVSVTLPTGLNDGPFYVNTTLKVMYPADHPEGAVIDRRTRRWTRNGLAIGASLILMGLGGYVAWYASHWDGSQES